MSQKVSKRIRRTRRERDLSRMKSYIAWCQQNVVVRDEDGIEYPVTAEEALQFIIMTTVKKKLK